MKLCYIKENMKYSREHNLEVTPKQAKMIIKKLHRHFKTPITKVECSRYQNGMAHIWNNFVYKISLPKNEMPMLLVLHEYAHALATHKYSKNVNHTKKFYHELKRVVHYSQKKNHWNINTPHISTQCVEELINART